MINGLLIGLELTFLPRKRGQWQEYRDEDEAQRVAVKLNEAFEADQTIQQAHAAPKPSAQ